MSSQSDNKKRRNKLTKFLIFEEIIYKSDIILIQRFISFILYVIQLHNNHQLQIDF